MPDDTFIPYCEKSKKFIRRKPEHDAFINILEGTVRSSKTWTMIPKILFGLNQYNVKGMRIIFGPTKDTVFDNILTDLFDFVGTDNYSYNRQNGELELYGVRWKVIGAKDEGSEKVIRGKTVGIAYGDELVLIPESFMKMMLTRMSPEGARFYGTTNPDSPFHYLKTDFLDNDEMRERGDLWSEHFDLDDNLSLSPAKRKQYEAMYTGVFKDRYIKGLWVMAEGAIYKDSWSDDLLYDDDTRPVTLFNAGGWVEQFVAIDYGTGNPTVYLHIIDDGTTYWVDREYYWDSKVTTVQKTDSQYREDLQMFIQNFAPNAECIIDPSAASFKVELVQNGIWHCDAKNEVLDGIRMVSSLLAKKRIRIHKRCVNLIKEIQAYSWDVRAQKRGEDEPLKAHDHSCDALRYCIFTKCAQWRVAA